MRRGTIVASGHGPLHMAEPVDSSQPRKGKLSAFALLKSWLFAQRAPEQLHAETEFLNTRDGHELGRFAKKAFGGDAEARQERERAVAVEQAEIDALLQGTGAIPMPPISAKPAPDPQPTADVPPKMDPRPGTDGPGAPLDAAVKHLDQLRAQGFSVETLAEALIVIESREVKRRDAKAA